jgi:hypothetical protein
MDDLVGVVALGDTLICKALWRFLQPDGTARMPLL